MAARTFPEEVKSSSRPVALGSRSTSQACTPEQVALPKRSHPPLSALCLPPSSFTVCTFLYSSSNAFCISKSAWRSFLTLCCSISRMTPACIACQQCKSIYIATLSCRVSGIGGSHGFLGLLLEMNHENDPDCS